VRKKRECSSSKKKEERWSLEEKELLCKKQNEAFFVFSILHCVLAENSQNDFLLFSISFTNFFLVFENAFLKIVKRTCFECFKKLKIENRLKTIKRTGPYF